MVMSQATLAEELKALEPSESEAESIDLLVDAYGTYASDAVGMTPAPIAITGAGVELGKTAMAASLTGMSLPGVGLTAIPSAITTFWSTVCAAYVVSFPGTVASVAPPHAGFPAALGAVFPANMAAALSLEDSTAALAAVMHTYAIVGGTISIAGPVVGVIL